jgi:hypothetical protein
MQKSIYSFSGKTNKEKKLSPSPPTKLFLPYRRSSSRVCIKTLRISYRIVLTKFGGMKCPEGPLALFFFINYLRQMSLNHIAKFKVSSILSPNSFDRVG